MTRTTILGIGAALAIGATAVTVGTSSDDAEFACASGPDCEWNSGLLGATWETAPAGRTLLPGHWRGGDCATKPGVEDQVGASMPQACLTWMQAQRDAANEKERRERADAGMP
jgi:hypothetical protein